MEIETKYSVPDEAIYQRLCGLDELAGAPLTDPQAGRVWDRYYDTATFDFLHAGYSYRVRNKGGRVIVTLKSIAAASGALHTRAEHETFVEPGTALQPDSWPAGEAADVARQIGRGQPLQLLVELLQERRTRKIVHTGDTVPAVELSLDKVEFSAAGDMFYELEAEERTPGQGELLARLDEVLTGYWGLTPQPLSKFERALQLHRPEVYAGLAGRVARNLTSDGGL